MTRTVELRFQVRDHGERRITITPAWPGEWNDWGFFEFKVFKKGTGHFRFKSQDDWAALNARVARIKGLTLPEKLRRKSR